MTTNNLSEFFNFVKDSDEIIIYTDGACSGNPGPGGWGAVFLSGETEEMLNGGEGQTTNNRMEMMAALCALEKIIEFDIKAKITIITDSNYLKDGVCSWVPKWKKNGWLTATKQPVKNQDLWVKLDACLAKKSVEWRWVKGHSGNKYNDLADTLARKAIIARQVGYQ